MRQLAAAALKHVATNASFAGHALTRPFTYELHVYQREQKLKLVAAARSVNQNLFPAYANSQPLSTPVNTVRADRSLGCSNAGSTDPRWGYYVPIRAFR